MNTWIWNTYSSITPPAKAMMACLNTLIFLTLMKVARNSVTPPDLWKPISNFPGCKLHKILLKWSNHKAESKKMHMWHITLAGQSPAANWNSSKLWRKARLSLNRKTSHGEVSTEAQHSYGFQHTFWVASIELESKQLNRWKIFSRQLLGLHWWKTFSALTSKAATHLCTHGQRHGTSTCAFSAPHDSSAPGNSCR